MPNINVNATLPKQVNIMDKTSAEMVLIAEGDLTTKTMLEETLHSHGYKTIHTANGDEALRLFKKHAPQTAILNISLSGKSGLDVCRKIRKLQPERHIPIILLSDTKDIDAKVEALNRGADDFLLKPVHGKELIAKIHAVEKIRKLYKEVEERNQELKLILDIMTTTSESINSDEILYSIVKKTADFIGATRCSIVLIPRDNEGYVVASHESPSIRGIKLNLRKYPELLKVLDTRESLVVEDMAREPLFDDVRGHIRNLTDSSLLILPIAWEEEVLGTMLLRTRREKKGYTDNEIYLCRIIAKVSYHPLKKARLFEEIAAEKEHLKTLAIKDQLTGLYNHNFFYNRLDDEFSRSKRYGVPLSLIMLDIDNFKGINDNFGHRAGDRTLKEVAAMLKKTARKADIVSRYGGEEFAIILPHTNLQGAKGEAERIRQLIYAHTYAGLKDVKVSTSIGVAAFPSSDIKNSGDLVNLADTALYEAKRNGKNRVVALGTGRV